MLIPQVLFTFAFGGICIFSTYRVVHFRRYIKKNNNFAAVTMLHLIFAIWGGFVAFVTAVDPGGFYGT